MDHLGGKLISTVSRIEEERLRKYIQKEVINHLYQVLNQSRDYFTTTISNQCRNLFKSYYQVQELIAGRLRYDLGITTAEAISVVNKIPDIIEKTINIYFKRDVDGISIEIGLVPMDYKDILNIPEAVFEHTRLTSSNPGQPIHWLEWLLLKGPVIIIKEYKIRYVNSGHSRSGGALMVQPGSGWRVPPPFDGVADHNIITRSLEDIDKFIVSEVLKRII